MANVFNPFGFRNFGHRDGMAPSMGLERRFIRSSDTNLYFTGDVVQQSSTTLGFLTTFTSAATTPAAGVFAGCEFFQPTVGRDIWSAFFPGNIGSSATVGDVTAYIISDPEMQFIAQGSTTAVVGSSMIGFGVTVTGNSSQGNQTTGISVQAINTTVVALSSVSLAPFKVVDVYSNFAPPGTTNVNGTDNTVPGSILVVAANNWDRKSLLSLST